LASAGSFRSQRGAGIRVGGIVALALQYVRDAPEIEALVSFKQVWRPLSLPIFRLQRIRTFAAAVCPR